MLAVSRTLNPDDDGPDFDFGASPALVTMTDGRDLLVIGQKSGAVVVDGTVYVNSGYAAFGGRPGNVLLAFAVE